MIEAPLLLRLQDFEKRHDEIVSYVFDVFTSMQKQYFTELSNVFSRYNDTISPESAPSLPLIVNHGSRQDIDEAKKSIAMNPQQSVSSMNQRSDSDTPSSSVHEPFLPPLVQSSPPSLVPPPPPPPPRKTPPPLPPSLRQSQKPSIPPPLPPGLEKRFTNQVVTVRHYS